MCQLHVKLLCLTSIAVTGDDLVKHISGHGLLARLWDMLMPALNAFCQNKPGDPAVVMQSVLDDLSNVVAKREPSGAEWRSLTASACRYRNMFTMGGDADQHFSEHGELVGISVIA